MAVSDEKLEEINPSIVTPSLVYTYKKGLYVNLTSRCPTACSFCIKFSWDYQYRGFNLKLPEDPSVHSILGQTPDTRGMEELVFCGYGESTYRLPEMAFLAERFREEGIPKVRLNTIGLGNLIHNRNIAPDLGRFLDGVSISLNTADPRQYNELHRPLPPFREKAFSAVLQFIQDCVPHIPETVVTAVERPEVDIEAVRDLAKNLGAQFRARPYLDEYEDS